MLLPKMLHDWVYVSCDKKNVTQMMTAANITEKFSPAELEKADHQMDTSNFLQIYFVTCTKELSTLRLR
jgi:hypothetical protein